MLLPPRGSFPYILLLFLQPPAVGDAMAKGSYYIRD
jgi:hypothetical protein